MSKLMKINVKGLFLYVIWMMIIMNSMRRIIVLPGVRLTGFIV